MNTQIIGSTDGQPFQNPYSSRFFDQVRVAYYLDCDLNETPAVDGTTSITAFQQAVIPDDNVTLKSTSVKLAVADATLIASFKPETILP